jgi:cytochrome c553
MIAIPAGLAFGVALSAAPLVTRAHADDAPPAWAYPVNPPDFKVQPDDGSPRHVPDSTAAFTVTQARNMFFALDWHPSEHPLLPDIVAHGRKPDVMACGVCHRADGPGGPENAGIAGLPTQYTVRQMADFKSGARTTSVPLRIPPQLMIKTARA